MDFPAGNCTSFGSQVKGNQINCSSSFSENMMIGFLVSSFSGFFIVVFALPLNIWVLWLMGQDTQRLLSSEMFAFNLAIMDVSYCLIYPLNWYKTYEQSTPFSNGIVFLTGLFMAGQPMLNSCICVERYLAVVYPVTFLKYKPVRYRAMCSGAVWLLALGFSSLTQIKFPLLPAYNLIVLCVASLAVSFFCSLSILIVLRRSGPGNGEREEMNLMKRRAFSNVLLILALTVVSYSPLSLVAMADVNGLIMTDYNKMAYSTAFFLYMSSSFVQPLHYLSRAGRLPGCRRPAET